MNEDFKRVFQAGTKLLPDLMTKNLSPIWGWLSSGADVDRDIIPTIQTIAKKKPDLNNWSYFTPAIKQAMQSRVKTEEYMKPEVTQQPSDIRRAELLSKTRAMNIFLNPHDRQWLEDYEAKHGIIACNT